LADFTANFSECTSVKKYIWIMEYIGYNLMGCNNFARDKLGYSVVNYMGHISCD
jgi:uncharacterized lipoprotein NlpE involved in copper resistance